MNKERRKLLEEISNKLEELKEQVAQLGSDEQDAYDNMPEGLQEGDRGDRMLEAVERIFEAENSLIETIEIISEAMMA